jgi:hypothetical protein
MKIMSPLLVGASSEKRLGIATVVAVQQVRRMRGGSQAQLIRCSDQNLYVVKFRNNPQHQRVLANEMLVALLARIVGLPVPEPAIVDVSEWLVRDTPELNIQLVGGTIPCQAGVQFGSQYAIDPLNGEVFDFMPSEMLERVRNVETFLGILVMDKWTGNADGRQAAFWRTMRQRNYTATFIDQGNCFNGGEWTFPDYPLRGVYPKNEVYECVLGWDSFQPWLSRIEDMSCGTISAAAQELPPVWYGYDFCALTALVRALSERRGLIRGLLTDFRASVRHPFPHWGEAEQRQPSIVA